jgi:hypothetical protein
MKQNQRNIRVVNQHDDDLFRVTQLWLMKVKINSDTWQQQMVMKQEKVTAARTISFTSTNNWNLLCKMKQHQRMFSLIRQ